MKALLIRGILAYNLRALGMVGLGWAGWAGLPILGGKVPKICVRMSPFYTTNKIISSLAYFFHSNFLM